MTVAVEAGPALIGPPPSLQPQLDGVVDQYCHEQRQGEQNPDLVPTISATSLRFDVVETGAFLTRLSSTMASAAP